MNAIEIKKDIYWVGAIDWNLRNFHGYLTQRGSSYNAYLILGKKNVLIDTVKHTHYDEMLSRIKSIVDPSEIDYLICNHVEMDHSGCIAAFAKSYNQVKIIASANGEKGLRMHYGDALDVKVVASKEELDIGERSLLFVYTPMVHWPDSMVTYFKDEKLLFSNDSFGQHIASSERFDDELDYNMVCEEAEKYYANIVLPYGAQVKKALNEISSVDIDTIAPSHGIIWRKYINDIVKLYNRWADNETEKKALVIYDTMWKSTGMVASVINDAFIASGVQSKMINLEAAHISDIMTELSTAKYICVGSPTLNNNMLPTVAAFLTYMKGLAPKKRVGLAFGSYGWSGQSISQIDEILKSCGFEVMEPIKVQYVPTEDILSDINEKIKNNLKEEKVNG